MTAAVETKEAGAPPPSEMYPEPELVKVVGRKEAWESAEAPESRRTILSRWIQGLLRTKPRVAMAGEGCLLVLSLSLSVGRGYIGRVTAGKRMRRGERRDLNQGYWRAALARF